MRQQFNLIRVFGIHALAGNPVNLQEIIYLCHVVFSFTCNSAVFQERGSRRSPFSYLRNAVSATLPPAAERPTVHPTGSADAGTRWRGRLPAFRELPRLRSWHPATAATP